MIWFMTAVAIIGGVLNTVQSGANATLSKSLGQPLVAALAVSLITAAVFVVLAAASGVKLSKDVVLQDVPWWAWTGGLMGCVYIFGSISFADKLGAALFIGLTVTAGLVTSVVLDHYGFVGFKQHTAGLGRIAGCILMVGGLALISVF